MPTRDCRFRTGKAEYPLSCTSAWTRETGSPASTVSTRLDISSETMPCGSWRVSRIGKTSESRTPPITRPSSPTTATMSARYCRSRAPTRSRLVSGETDGASRTNPSTVTFDRVASTRSTSEMSMYPASAPRPSRTNASRY